MSCKGLESSALRGGWERTKILASRVAKSAETALVPKTDSEMENLSDGALLRATDQNSEAFGLFYDRHVRAILALRLALTGSPDTAADVTAETFARAYLARKQFRDESGTARPWLVRIAQNELRKSLRKWRAERRACKRLSIEPPPLDDISIQRIDEILELAPTRARVREAMEELSPRLAAALHLRVELELSYREVARRLGCSEPAARTRVFRGLSQLEKTLEAGV